MASALFVVPGDLRYLYSVICNASLPRFYVFLFSVALLSFSELWLRKTGKREAFLLESFQRSLCGSKPENRFFQKEEIR